MNPGKSPASRECFQEEASEGILHGQDHGCCHLCTQFLLPSPTGWKSRGKGLLGEWVDTSPRGKVSSPQPDSPGVVEAHPGE